MSNSQGGDEFPDTEQPAVPPMEPSVLFALNAVRPRCGEPRSHQIPNGCGGLTQPECATVGHLACPEVAMPTAGFGWLQSSFGSVLAFFGGTDAQARRGHRFHGIIISPALRGKSAGDASALAKQLAGRATQARATNDPPPRGNSAISYR
jgi:hypothetical protein